MARGRKTFNSDRRLEASGIPRRGDKSPELALMVARRLGLAPPIKFDNLQLPEIAADTNLGNQELPIWEYKDAIVSTINENPITICLAETGSGKSTQIPQYLFEAGFATILTQPRRLAAEMVSRRIGQEVASQLGPDGYALIGFQTAEKSTITEDTRVQVVTDGLQLVRELGMFEQGEVPTGDSPRVIIIDEVHERNTNIDVLLAWAKKGLVDGSDTRVVITTAGINAERMARYFSIGGFVPPIIEVPGRSYEIERSEEPTSDVIDQAVLYARKGNNVLVFLPGVTEIEQTLGAVRKKLSGDKSEYEFLSLHGKMSRSEQRSVEIEYAHPKIVFATNVAETSITIPDVDVVIDSGLERRIEIDREGVESLQVAPISQASCKQRAGRCGRTKPGTYVLTRLNRRVQHEPLINRPEYATPEILRSNVDKTVLSIAAAGLDINDLPLPDPLDGAVVKRAKKALQVLGALDSEMNITARGQRMNQFPVRPSLSRMITYAEERSFKTNIKVMLAAMIASVESGGLPDYTSSGGNAWRKLHSESTSDLLAQLDMFLQIIDVQDSREIAELGLNTRSVERARELYHKLLVRMDISFTQPESAVSQDEKEKLRECIVAGMIDFVYERRGKEYWRTSARLGKAAVGRELGDRSVVRGNPNLVVGIPYALASPPGKNLPELPILQDVTKTTARQLGEVGTELCVWRDSKDSYVWRDGQAYRQYEKVFRDTVQTGEYRNEAAEWSVELAEEIIAQLRRRPGKNLRRMLTLKKLSERLYHMSGELEPIHDNELTDALMKASGIRKKSMTDKPMNPDMLDVALSDHVAVFEKCLPSDSEQQRIIESSPEWIEFEGLSLSIAYRSGVPRVAKLTDDLRSRLASTNGSLQLPDGRDIYLHHKLGRKSRAYTIDEFRELGL